MKYVMNPEPRTQVKSSGSYIDCFPEKGILELDRLIIQSGTTTKHLKRSNYRNSSEYYSDLILYLLDGYYLVNGRIQKIISRYYNVLENPS